MKKTMAIAVILIISVILAAVLIAKSDFQSRENPKAFVGVAYCGNSVAEGKQLIDKVKGYTNLLVLQSGSLQRDLKSVNELGDYAVSAGLYFLPYFGNYIESTFSVWLESAKQRWGTHLVGVYYSDELGGKMLDDYSEFKDAATGDSITKTRYGDIVVAKSSGVVVHYELNGVINLYEPSKNSQEDVYSTFYPNGTITVKEPNSLPSSITYQQLASARPFKDINEVAERFLNRSRDDIGFLKNSTTVFSSDYALHWFDYLAGYDVMLAQVGWNISLNQQIGLCRGAATTQDKDWGVVITWKYNSPPYLDSGTEIFNQLKTSYECGAKYFVLFNYYEEGQSNPYGTLKDEHFAALESFWNNVVRNPQVAQGSVKADSVLVLPKNYGWGMRWKDDIIWGVFKADDTTGKLWDLLQVNLKEHDLKLDIIYEDSAFTLPTQYQNITRFKDKR